MLLLKTYSISHCYLHSMINSKSDLFNFLFYRCESEHTIYGGSSLPVLREESKMNVNQWMLKKSFVVLFFLAVCTLLYVASVAVVHTSQRARLQRRNIWLRDNKPHHPFAYLLTIKTGTQHNSGTMSKVCYCFFFIF